MSRWTTADLPTDLAARVFINSTASLRVCASVCLFYASAGVSMWQCVCPSGHLDSRLAVYSSLSFVRQPFLQLTFTSSSSEFLVHPHAHPLPPPPYPASPPPLLTDPPYQELGIRSWNSLRSAPLWPDSPPLYLSKHRNVFYSVHIAWGRTGASFCAIRTLEGHSHI
jgi:hypothetical protein